MRNSQQANHHESYVWGTHALSYYVVYQPYWSAQLGYQYKTPFVLITSPSLPFIVLVAILMATASALNALSAL
jgi:hypothetical protein